MDEEGCLEIPVIQVRTARRTVIVLSEWSVGNASASQMVITRFPALR